MVFLQGAGEPGGRARRVAGADRAAAVQLLAGRRRPAASGQQGVAWFVYALIILLAWGVQGYFMKLANATMDAENIFLYMTLTALLLIPVALWMTDFSTPINYGWQGPGLAAITQILNAVGALTLVYAFRYGRRWWSRRWPTRARR